MGCAGVTASRRSIVTNQRSLTVNVDQGTVAKLDELVVRHRPFLKRHAVHRVALLLGLDALRAEPDRLVHILEAESRSAP